MSKEKIKSVFKRYSTLFFLLGVTIVAVGAFSVLSQVFTGHDLLFQILAVVLSVIFTAIVTSTLLSGQTDKEEEREKSIKVYENKIAAFSQFISTMWAIQDTKDGESIKPAQIYKLRTEAFDKIIFYLDSEQMKSIAGIFREFKFDSDETLYTKAFSKVTKILRENLMKDVTCENDIAELWGSFNSMAQAVNDVCEESDECECEEPETSSQSAQAAEESPAPQTSGDVKISKWVNGCLHFNILRKGWHYGIFDKMKNSDKFGKGVLALGLCEYNKETWRTDKVKRSKKDQIVFLYQSGGPGYVGAFLVKGWVVVESSGDKVASLVLVKNYDQGGDERKIEEKEIVNEYVDLLCADRWLKEGSTSVAYLLVVPIFFSEKGVGRVSGVYRSTISSYHPVYAWKTLERMSAVPDDLSGYYTLNNEKKSLVVDRDAFEKILKNNNIR